MKLKKEQVWETHMGRCITPYVAGGAKPTAPGIIPTIFGAGTIFADFEDASSSARKKRKCTSDKNNRQSQPHTTNFVTNLS